MANAAVASRARSASRPLNVDRAVRLAHGYIGMLIAPSVLFFALSGGLQVFRLHEAHDRYAPPAAFVVLGALHKNQQLPAPPRRSAARGSQRERAQAGAPHRDVKLSTLALRWLSVVVAAGLSVSTALGVWMALRDRLRRRVNLVLLALGALVPLVLALV